MSEYMQAIINQRNAMMQRMDIEWALDAGGNPYLRDKPEAMSRHTRDLEVKREKERRDFNWRQSHPVQEAAE
jgi:hypothetical protein